MFDPYQLCEYVIEPALKDINMYSKGAEQLLLGTACVESRLGTYIKQIRGPAMGIFQIEPNTHTDLWKHYIAYRSDLKLRLTNMVPKSQWRTDQRRPHHFALINSLSYSTAMARLVYRRHPDAMPQEDDWEGMAAFWKKAYNTYLGAGTEEKFMKSLEVCGVR